MKKIIMMLMVMGGAVGAVNAETQFDFDGRRGSFPSAQASPAFAVLAEQAGRGEEVRVTEPVPAAVQDAFSENLPDSVLRHDIGIAEKAGKKLVAESLKNLLARGTLEEKTAYVTVVGVYVIPEIFVPAETAPRSRDSWTYGPEYQESESEVTQISGAEVCRIITKRFCRLACRMGSNTSAGYEECRTECRNIIEKACDLMKSCRK